MNKNHEHDSVMNTKELGFFGENLAGRYLEDRGYKILDRNYRVLVGEIDLIVEKDGAICFTEVKTNRGSASERGAKIFAPELRVDRKKVSHISKVASIYLDKKGWLGKKDWQIDIVSVVVDEVGKSAKIKHFKNVASDIW